MYDGLYCSCIVAAGGLGIRLGSKTPKQFLKLSDKTVLEYTLTSLSSCDYIDEIILSSPSDYFEMTNNLSKNFKKVKVVYIGGESRQETVFLGLNYSNGGIILIHDGVRPFIQKESIEAVIKAAARHRAAILAVMPKETVHFKDFESKLVTMNRENCYLAQTPQAFDANLIKQAHMAAKDRGFLGSDDAGLVEELGINPEIVLGDYLNIKITTPEDLLLANLIIEQMEYSN